jgi:hypothetical protein
LVVGIFIASLMHCERIVYNAHQGRLVAGTRPVGFLLAHVNSDGSISETNQNRNYNTAVCLTALAATHNT